MTDYDALHAAAMVDWPKNISNEALAAWLELDAAGIQHEKADLLRLEAAVRLDSMDTKDATLVGQDQEETFVASDLIVNIVHEVADELTPAERAMSVKALNMVYLKVAQACVAARREP